MVLRKISNVHCTRKDFSHLSSSTSSPHKCIFFWSDNIKCLEDIVLARNCPSSVVCLISCWGYTAATLLPMANISYQIVAATNMFEDKWINLTFSCIWFLRSFWRSDIFERIYQRLFSFKSIKVIKRCCDVFGQISILPPAVFLQTLLFRPWREFFKSGETHLWNLHTLSTRDPPYHTLCFYIYKTQEKCVF